ncbi:Uncharacterized conserved protein YcbK, DUF882 family [Arboricoccus pini]|uniref:Murein endopeptidase K n=1 Tax=Arboricoccus pini TaxID=1963835 RepID=A0A212R3C9_9PROT|nr:DUF882 domain-containing protein [Arboricoccus pini]SNB66500.1 Uncharacterized conserved protein YcbK, DUF882 family [Arboricoccus pini]
MTDEADRSPKSRRWLLGGLVLPTLAMGAVSLSPLSALAAVKKKHLATKIVSQHSSRKLAHTTTRTAAGTARHTRTLAGLPSGVTHQTHGQPGLVVPYGANNGAPLNAPVRQLALYNRRNGESIRPIYYQNGQYRPDAMEAIKRFMRDWRSDSTIDIDPGLADILWSLQRRLVPEGCIDMVCGYRSPATNAMLRRTNRGVALNSFHMYGRAMDVRIANVSLQALHTTALKLGSGGVGYYPSSNFVHVDNGPIRQWGQNGHSYGA